MTTRERSQRPAVRKRRRNRVGADVPAAGASGRGRADRRLAAVPEEPERPFWLRASDAVSVGALLALLGLAALRLLLRDTEAALWWPSLLALGAALFCADLLSGLVHWIGDRFFSESTPLLGRMLIRPFREHHRDPLAITRHDLFELSGNNALAVLPLALLLARSEPASRHLGLVLQTFGLFFALAVLATNLIHQWAHRPRNGRVVRWLQGSGLILSPAAHARHHRGDFSQGYCVTTGWGNSLLDAWRVLPRVEAALRRSRVRAGAGPVRHPASATTCTAGSER